MRETDPHRLSINLGPRFAGTGDRVGLNLGVEWDDDLPEPVVRGIRRAVSFTWERPKAAIKVAVVGWARAQVIDATAAVPWAAAGTVRRHIRGGWGLSPLLNSEGEMCWRGWAQRVAGRVGLVWQALAITSRQLNSPWRARVASAVVQAELRWLIQRRAGAGCSLDWRSREPSLTSTLLSPWQHPRLGMRATRLPWSVADRVSWGIRPAPGPEPQPEPGLVPPPGDRVGLNLGCFAVNVPGLAPLNLGISACYVVRPQRRTYVVINEVSFVRLPDRIPIELARVSLSAGRSAWGWTFDIELADADQLGLLKPAASGPRQFELVLNGYVWTGIIESFQKQREFAGGGVRLSGRSRTALLAPPYAPARVKATTEERSMAQLVAEELADTGFASRYDTVDWLVPPGAWFYDASTPLDAISALAGASGGVVQSHPSDLALVVRASYPASPWLWRETTPDHLLQEDIVLTESLQMRSAPLYDAVVVTGELAGKGVTCKVRKGGEEGKLFAQQVSSPLINVAAAAAERGRNILCDRGEQAAVDLTVPLFPKPLKAGEIGVILPLDLVQVLSSEGTWHGQCESIRIEVVVDQQAVVIEQTATLERHFTDAD